ncbi:uncharacterized protein LOC135486364 [Lineus longissimus]|uniref:uncharacterized protein LOC135486364 n=1 Tax=Lineus longissimus TaxID=88925 RepID=UPI00315DB53F
MPRSEEWSKGAWKWQKEILQNLKWSDEREVFYTLEELMAFGTEWPKMIMPEEGWLGDGESVSFCAGEALVGLGVRSFKRIAACPWEEYFNTSIAEMIKKATPRYLIPLSTMGELRHASRVKILRIQSEEQVYTTMEDLWKFHPRYAMPDKTFTAGNEIVKSGETIELRSPENGCITCYLKAIDKTVPVPMTQRGDFTIVEDGTSYTLQQVYENFKLPQRVRFESLSAGMYRTEILLISETRYDVLIACVPAGLYVEDKEEERTEPWGTRDEDFTDISFIFLPRPISEESPLADTKFLTWLYDPNDLTCQVIMSRASVFELDRFKDMNVVINATSASILAVMEYSAKKIYDYIKVRDFTGDNSVSPHRGKSTAAPAVSVGSPSTSWLHSGSATKAVTVPFSEETTIRPKPESSSKMFKHMLQKIKSPVLTLKRNKSVSYASSDKPEEPHETFYNIPRVDDYNMKSQDRRPRNMSLPLLTVDGSDSEDDEVQATDWKIQAHVNKSSERGRLPLPRKAKKEDQNTAQLFPLSKLPSEDMYDQNTRKKEKDVIAKLGPRPSLPPKPVRRHNAVQGQRSVVQGQVAAIQGQIAVCQGQSTSTQGLKAVTRGKVAVVRGRRAVVQGQVTVAQSQVPASSAPGGPRKIKFPPPNGNLVPLSELTPEQLALLFKYFNLEELAEQLKRNRIDGEFFEKSLANADFAGDPFFATEFQLKQIERIRNGKY